MNSLIKYGNGRLTASYVKIEGVEFNGKIGIVLEAVRNKLINRKVYELSKLIKEATKGDIR